MDELLLADVKMAQEKIVATRKWIKRRGAVTCTKEKKNENE